MAEIRAQGKVLVDGVAYKAQPEKELTGPSPQICGTPSITGYGLNTLELMHRGLAQLLMFSLCVHGARHNHSRSFQALVLGQEWISSEGLT